MEDWPEGMSEDREIKMTDTPKVEKEGKVNGTSTKNGTTAKTAAKETATSANGGKQSNQKAKQAKVSDWFGKDKKNGTAES